MAVRALIQIMKQVPDMVQDTAMLSASIPLNLSTEKPTCLNLIIKLGKDSMEHAVLN